MSGLWKPLILTLVLSRVCFTQTPPAKTRVEGKVTNQAGQPLANATVALIGINGFRLSALPPAYTTSSSSSGDFLFDDVEPNQYRLSVQRPGYLDFVYAEPDGRGDFPIALGDRKTIEVKMTGPSFISGKITTEDGEPFPDARITVFRVRRANGKQRLDAAGTLVAGVDGSFSTGGLRTGRFYLAASMPPSLPLLSQREIGGAERYVTTYYPSALDTSAAALIEVPSETELRNIDIHVRRSRVFHISGKIVNPPGTSWSSAVIDLLRPGVTNANPRDANQIYPTGDGTFQVNGQLPGLYALRGTTEDRRYQGHLSVTISDHDVDDVVLTLAPALDIALSIRIVDADPQQAQSIRLPVRFILTATDSVNENAMAQFIGNRTWRFNNIGLGTYHLSLSATEGAYVKSVRFGDQDITNRELDTKSSGSAIDVSFSPHAAEINGVLLDSSGQSLAGVTVTLWHPGLPPPGTVDQTRSTRTDTSGKFHFGSLAPGEYRVAAWEHIDLDTAEIPEFLARFDDQATIVRVGEDSRETVQPALISRDKVEAEAAKLR